MPVWVDVYSSNVEAVAYEDGAMLVRWNNGKVSAYKGVPPQTFRDVSTSWSVGQALNEQVKSQYPHQYVQVDDDAS